MEHELWESMYSEGTFYIPPVKESDGGDVLVCAKNLISLVSDCMYRYLILFSFFLPFKSTLFPLLLVHE